MGGMQLRDASKSAVKRCRRAVDVRQPHEFRFGSRTRGTREQGQRGGPVEARTGCGHARLMLERSSSVIGDSSVPGNGVAGTSGVESGKAEASVSAIAGDDVDG